MTIELDEISNEETGVDSQFDLLIVLQQAPYSSASANEALDLALAAGTFEQKVALLFIEDGVYQLMSEQAPDALQQKSLEKMINALSFYGVSMLAVESHSLFERDLHPEKHIIQGVHFELLNTKSIQDLYDRSKTIIRF